MERNEPDTVLIYSPDWTHRTALENLFSQESLRDGLVIKTAETVSDLLANSHSPPALIILDIQPRSAPGIIMTLRRKYPLVSLIFTGDYFLYSDRIVAEYFGGIWLKQYDALMAGYPATGVMEHMTSSLFAGACPSVRIFSDTTTINDVLPLLDLWLSQRLAGVVSSYRMREVALDWFVRGVSLREVACRLRRSEKVLYHYRCLMMQALGIRHYSRDFIPSLTVTAGPVRRGGSVEPPLPASAG